MEAASNPEAIDLADFAADPLGCLARHREIHWWAPLGHTGASQVLEYAAVRDLMAREDDFGAWLGPFFEQLMSQNPELHPAHAAALRNDNARSLINLDGEEHQRLRGLVARNFTPRSVARLRPFLGEYAAELADYLQPGDDFMAGFARDLPARALCALTGIPSEDHDLFVAWIDILEVQLAPARLLTIDRAESERILAAHRELRAYCTELVRRRREEPGDDLVSRLAAETAALGDGDIVTLIGDLVFAGNDTTRNALGLMVMTLAEHPGAWEAIAEDPSLAPAAVEEVLRLQSPAPGPVRCVREQIAYRDRTFEAGEVVLLSTWSANHDPSFWGATAGSFDPARKHAGEHLSFGHGPHFCLGAGLAREEMRAALVALTSTIRDLRILEAPEMHAPGSIYGPVSLRIDFERR